MISALILAAKFFCETQDVVINGDIARFLANSRTFSSDKLNEMEGTLAELIDYNLFVSQQDYNKEANKLNI